MPQWVSWVYNGQTGSQSSHKWVTCGSQVGHVGCPGHVDGSVGHVGPMGLVWDTGQVNLCLKSIGATRFYLNNLAHHRVVYALIHA